jgi:hypothetical protein
MQQSKFTLCRFVSCLSLFTLGLGACGGDDDGNNDNNQQMMTVDRNVYPVAPYGTEETATLDNLSFKNADASDFTLNDIYSDESNKLLLVSTSSGWCVSCIEEQAKLQERYNVWGSKGLYILLSTFEDAQFQPATPEYAGEWKERYNLTYTVVADTPFIFQNYYDKAATPMVMLVDVNTMTILKIMTGFDESVVDAIIEASLN